MTEIELAGDKVKLSLSVDDEGRVAFAGLEVVGATAACTLCRPYPEYAAPVVEVQLAGDDTMRHYTCHGATQAGRELHYVSHELEGGHLTLSLRSARLAVKQHFRLAGGDMIESWAEVTNISSSVQTLEYVSSLALPHIDACDYAPWERYLWVNVPVNSWCAEAQWQRYSLPQLGLHRAYEQPLKYSAALTDPKFRRQNLNLFTSGRASIASSSSMSSEHYAPLALIEDTLNQLCLFFQINHNGAWQYEINDFKGHLNLLVSGPTGLESQWYQALAPQESFTTVPVAFGLCSGDRYAALDHLTAYRRSVMRPCTDSTELPIIFNDYMNCLMGDPNEEILVPLIDRARAIGAEYFCIDCGWYADGFWWDSVGEWLPSAQRFPSGIAKTLDYIRAQGMIPGLWLEIESMGVKCQLAQQWPDSCFLMRHGKRVVSEQRYHLDFRHELVRAHADAVVRRLVEDYGVGYIKMDYNIDSGVGSEVDASSFGSGLLLHQRAYLEWLDSIFARYPNLVIENCGSGGMRMDYAMLQRHSIQSVTDQTDFRIMSAIACNAASLVTPEQAAIWAYPLKSATPEEVVTNMINALLLRVHQSGAIEELDAARLSLVTEALTCYKALRADIKDALPFWPLGFATIGDPYLSFGLKTDQKLYLAVFRGEAASDVISLPLPRPVESAQVLYPHHAAEPYSLSADGTVLNVSLPQNFMSRLFVLS